MISIGHELLNLAENIRVLLEEESDCLASPEDATYFRTVIKKSTPKLYRNNLKNREFGKEGPQNLHSERGTIAERQGPSENASSEVNPTQPKPDSSGCFGINTDHLLV